MQEDLPFTRIAIRYGVLFGLIAGVYTIILYITAAEQNKVLPWLGVAVLIAGLVAAMKEYRKQNNGFMSYGQGLGIGALIGAISGLCSSTLGIFYTQVIDSAPIQRGLDAAREMLEKQGKSDAEIETALEISQKFQSPGIMFAMGVIGSLITMFIVSLIVAAILQKKRPVFE